MNNSVELICKEHDLPLLAKNDELFCGQGCVFTVINQIPRFVPAENYSSSFGLQWNAFRTTQLDSATGLTISRDRLARIAGGSLDVFQQKKVLEAGCGAGRFTELMLEAGASVFAVDLSNAVDANFKNCSTRSNYFVCQADIRTLPVHCEQFDVVVCIGVIQHTPDPEETIKVLCSHVKPGGVLLIDHYTYGYHVTPFRSWLRQQLLKMSEENAMRFVRRMVWLLWPLHKAFYKHRENKMVKSWRPRFIYWSPVVDYHDLYSQLGQRLMYEWAVLDTHDTLTDRYKHMRSVEEIRSHLESLGMIVIEATYAGNGVEARAKKPVRE